MREILGVLMAKTEIILRKISRYEDLYLIYVFKSAADQR